MKPEFWRGRWSEGRIRFHEGKPNSYLVRHLDKLSGRVFVPMCGKTHDMALIAAHGHHVVGVELVEDAVKAFFDEHKLEPEIAARGPLVEYTAPGIQIYAGDIFATTLELLGPIDSIYDRAALIALPADMRKRYAEHLRWLGAKRVLLLSFEYDQSKMDGPPFSVDEAEIRALYAGATVELLSEGPDPRERENSTPCVERCYSITL